VQNLARSITTEVVDGHWKGGLPCVPFPACFAINTEFKQLETVIIYRSTYQYTAEIPLFGSLPPTLRHLAFESLVFVPPAIFAVHDFGALFPCLHTLRLNVAEICSQDYETSTDGWVRNLPKTLTYLGLLPGTLLDSCTLLKYLCGWSEESQSYSDNKDVPFPSILALDLSIPYPPGLDFPNEKQLPSSIRFLRFFDQATGYLMPRMSTDIMAGVDLNQASKGVILFDWLTDVPMELSPSLHHSNINTYHFRGAFEDTLTYLSIARTEASVEGLKQLPRSLTTLKISSLKLNDSLPLSTVMEAHLPELAHLEIQHIETPHPSSIDASSLIIAALPRGLTCLSLRNPVLIESSTHLLPPTLTSLSTCMSATQKALSQLPKSIRHLVIYDAPELPGCREAELFLALPPQLTQLQWHGLVHHLSGKQMPRTLSKCNLPTIILPDSSVTTDEEASQAVLNTLALESLSHFPPGCQLSCRFYVGVQMAEIKPKHSRIQFIRAAGAEDYVIELED
jgi:hypothetical protein